MNLSDHGLKSNHSNRRLQLSLRRSLFNEKPVEKPTQEKEVGNTIDLSIERISRAKRKKRLDLIKMAGLFMVILIPTLIIMSKFLFAQVEILSEPDYTLVDYKVENNSTFLVVENYQNHVKLGKYYLKRERYTMAKAHFQKAIELFPSGSQANFGLTKCVSKLCELKGQFCEELDFNKE